MARGWESKSVEEQQSQFSKSPGEKKESLSADEEKEIQRRRTLELNRARVLEQLSRSQNERYTEMLKQELAELERKLSQGHASLP